MKFFRNICLLMCLALAFIISGCVASSAPYEPELASGLNVAERAPGSLGLDVLEYSWTFLNDGAHIRVRGTVRNNSGAPFQSVTLHAMLYDQKERLLARGSSYIAPTYLKPGAVGDFEFVTVASRDSGIRNTRLVSNCQTSGF